MRPPIRSVWICNPFLPDAATETPNLNYKAGRKVGFRVPRTLASAVLSKR